MISGKKVSIQYDSKQERQDKYGRELLYIWVDDIFVNDYMVEEGYAYAYRKIDSEYLDQFIEAENRANSNEKGLWGSECKP